MSDNETILFIGGHYEVKGSEITKYYFAGATRIAMRKYVIPQSMSVEYFLGDHLGSTSLTTDSNGAKISEIRYKPWGEVRSTWTSAAVTTPAYALTRQTFTGQYSYMDDPSTATTEGFGLMYYGARMYDPALGRFTSADSIVPAGVQGMDRYAYVNNSPVRYTDPSGHSPDDCGGRTGYKCQIHNKKLQQPISYEKELREQFHWVFDGYWTNTQLKMIYQVALDIEALAGSKDVMVKMFGWILWDKDTLAPGRGGQTPSAHHITMNSDGKWGLWSVAHELGHAWDANTNNWGLSKGLQSSVNSRYPEMAYSEGMRYIDYGSSGNGPGATGWPESGDPRWDTWDEAKKWNKVEDFAQSFVAYVYPKEALTKFSSYGESAYPGYSGYRDTSRGQFIQSQIP